MPLKHWINLNGASLLHRLRPRQVPHEFGILMYHRVADAVPGVPFPTWNVTPDRLRMQLGGLLDAGFEPWPLRRMLQAHYAGLPIPDGAFVVTFDDGYANNFTAALPILQELNVPATLFLATAYLDSDRPFPNDDWEAAGSPTVPGDAWRPLTTDEARSLLDSGIVEIGCHTHTHADFRQRPESLRTDLEQSLSVLRTRFGIRQATFAFPYGTRRLGFAGPELVQVVQQAGLLCSLTTESEPAELTSSPFGWGRFTAAQEDTPQTLAAKIDGWYSLLRSQWQQWSSLGGLASEEGKPAERDQVSAHV